MVLLNKIVNFIIMTFFYIIGIPVFILLIMACLIKSVVFFLAKKVWEFLFAFEEKISNYRMKKKYGKFLDIISAIADAIER
jgi:TM2 domain-containing membrane protein YozV